jgi:hypothetical protein
VVNAISAAELQLSAALVWLTKARTDEDRERAQRKVARAREALEKAKNAAAATSEATRAVAANTCCGLLMTWHEGKWICTYGHD